MAGHLAGSLTDTNTHTYTCPRIHARTHANTQTQTNTTTQTSKDRLMKGPAIITWPINQASGPVFKQRRETMGAKRFNKWKQKAKRSWKFLEETITSTPQKAKQSSFLSVAVKQRQENMSARWDNLDGKWQPDIHAAHVKNKSHFWWVSRSVIKTMLSQSITSCSTEASG